MKTNKKLKTDSDEFELDSFSIKINVYLSLLRQESLLWVD